VPKHSNLKLFRFHCFGGKLHDEQGKKACNSNSLFSSLEETLPNQNHAMNDTSVILKQVEDDLGYPAATLLVTDDPEKRHFIGEMLLMGAAIFVLQRYCAGFLQGVGLDDAAKQHGQKTREFLGKLRSGSVKREELDQQKEHLSEALKEVSSHGAAIGYSSGEHAVQEALEEAGATAQQAKTISEKVTEAITPDDSRGERS
jgi:hypothetical protein